MMFAESSPLAWFYEETFRWGLVLCYKRLEQGKFAWPKVQDGMMRLTKGQFEALFEGLDWRRVMARRARRPGATE